MPGAAAATMLRDGSAAFVPQCVANMAVEGKQLGRSLGAVVAGAGAVAAVMGQKGKEKIFLHMATAHPPG